jgi:AcrR family transcriptional regulator
MSAIPIDTLPSLRRSGVTEIVRDAGIAAAMLDRYFDDKEGIFRAVVADLYASWLARAREVLTGPGTAIERITRPGLPSVAFTTENPLLASVYRRDHEIVFAPLDHSWRRARPARRAAGADRSA